MGLSKICWRPLSGMVGMRVVKTDNIQPLLGCLSLNGDQLFGIDVVAVLGPIITRIAAPHYLLHGAIVLPETAQQDAAAFMRIRLFAVAAKRFVFGLSDDQHIAFPKKKNPLGWRVGRRARNLRFSSPPALARTRRGATTAATSAVLAHGEHHLECSDRGGRCQIRMRFQQHLSPAMASKD